LQAREETNTDASLRNAPLALPLNPSERRCVGLVPSRGAPGAGYGVAGQPVNVSSAFVGEQLNRARHRRRVRPAGWQPWRIFPRTKARRRGVVTDWNPRSLWWRQAARRVGRRSWRVTSRRTQREHNKSAYPRKPTSQRTCADFRNNDSKKLPRRLVPIVLKKSPRSLC